MRQKRGYAQVDRAAGVNELAGVDVDK
eukprot:SAG31_NODE_41694_length_275_cov_0.573864_1_plen_26_part_01